jgi:glycosyltransferase involved in cell wall biosynthesis
MKLAHVVWSGRIGGIGRVVFDLANVQRASGHEVVLMFAQGEGLFVDRAVELGIPIQDYGLKSGFDLSPTAVFRAARVMRAFDLLHIHDFSVFFAVAAILARRPLVYTDHGHALSVRDRSFSRKFRDCLRAVFVRSFPFAVTANSDFTRRLSCREFGIAIENIDVVYNGVDPRQIRPSCTRSQIRHALGLPDRAFVVGTVCRLATFKRVDRLIAGFAHMQNNSQARLLIVGDGPLLSDLRSQAAALAIADRVLFTGARSDVPDLLQAMDVFVQSSYGEPFGIAALEAMTAGLPVLAFSDSGGVLEILGQNKTLLADEQELGRILDEWITRPNRLAPISPLNNFHIEHTAHNFDRIYSRIYTQAKVPAQHSL